MAQSKPIHCEEENIAGASCASAGWTGVGVVDPGDASVNDACDDAAGAAEAGANAAGTGFLESFVQRYPVAILETLLCDRTTCRNIIWADNEYEALGEGYMGDDEITVEKITGLNSGVIKPRIAKEQEKKTQRTKSRAEVFTPSWLCNKMNNDIDEVWFGRRDVFNVETEGGKAWMPQDGAIEFPDKKGAK